MGGVQVTLCMNTDEYSNHTTQFSSTASILRGAKTNQIAKSQESNMWWWLLVTSMRKQENFHNLKESWNHENQTVLTQGKPGDNLDAQQQSALHHCDETTRENQPKGGKNSSAQIQIMVHSPLY